MSDVEALVAALVELDEEATLTAARRIVDDGSHSSVSVLQACQRALRVVGERYERHEYYLAGLILAGELFKEVLSLVQPEGDGAEDDPSGRSEGLVLLGTVQGDIHDIGKNLFHSALRGFGFRVIDLGVDVPNETFLAETLAHRPDVVCMSGLITPAFKNMKIATDLIRSASPEMDRVPPIVLGGGTVDDQVCRFVGADSWSSDSMEGVRICQRLVQQTYGGGR